MAEKRKSLGGKEGHTLTSAQETVTVNENWEKSFAYITNTMDNEAMGKALRHCGLIEENAYVSLKNILTVYRLNYLLIKITLCLDNATFEKLCHHVDSREKVKELSYLYHAYRSLLIPSSSLNESECQGRNSFTLGYSLINLQFILLMNQIQALIKSPTKLLDDCEKLMASKTYSTPLFVKDYLKSFSKFKPEVLFHALSIFWTWSDHSILRELLHLGQHTEALALLDKFDRYLENSKSHTIEKFPLPMLSKRMIPVNVDTCAHTILAIKIKKAYHKCILQNIFEARKSLINTCEITRNAFQLLGVLNNYSDFTVIYWLIPTCVVSLITTSIMDSKSLHEKDIMEIAIYPNTVFCTGTNVVRYGPLAGLIDISSKNVKPAKPIVKGFNNLVVYLSRTEELPEIIQMLLSDLGDSHSQHKQVLSENKELISETERKDAHIKDLKSMLKKKSGSGGSVPLSEEKHRSMQDKEMDYEKLQSEAESLFKVRTESLKSELSDLQSKMMIKDTQNRKLAEENEMLKKHLNKLKEKVENKDKDRVEEKDMVGNNGANSELSGPHVPSEYDQLLSQELQQCNDEIKRLNVQTDKMQDENAQLISENEALNNQLKETRDTCAQKIKQLKVENSDLSKNLNTVNKKLDKCKKKKQNYKSACYHASTAATLASKPSDSQPSRHRKSHSISVLEHSRCNYDGEDSSTSTSAGTSSKEPVEEGKNSPCQAEDDNEDDQN